MLPEGLEEELRSASLQGWGSRDSEQYIMDMMKQLEEKGLGVEFGVGV